MESFYNANTTVPRELSNIIGVEPVWLVRFWPDQGDHLFGDLMKFIIWVIPLAVLIIIRIADILCVNYYIT